MGTRPRKSETSLLHQWGIALINAGAQPEIAAELDEVGYDTAKIAEGKELLDRALITYNKNKKEDGETSEAYADFADKREKLDNTYKKHRKFALVAFKNDPLMTGKLEISGYYPKVYINWYKKVSKFYEVMTTSADALAGLARFKVTPQVVATAKAQVRDLQYARARYLKEKGESEAATKAKDAALSTMEHWMSDFYIVARIALEEKPQLLEALGKKVKS